MIKIEFINIEGIRIYRISNPNKTIYYISDNKVSKRKADSWKDALNIINEECGNMSIDKDENQHN